MEKENISISIPKDTKMTEVKIYINFKNDNVSIEKPQTGAELNISVKQLKILLKELNEKFK